MKLSSGVGHILRTAAGSVLLVAMFLIVSATAASARNPLSSYLARLLDESRAEIAIGEVLSEAFIAELALGSQASPGSGSAFIAPSMTAAAIGAAENETITGIVAELATRCPRPTMPYSVRIVDSCIPANIAFPGGPIVITTALWLQTRSPAEKEFLIARNLMHVALRQPMIAIKHEGLYARVLKLLKQGTHDPQMMRLAVRDYMQAAETMDQKRADREGVMLSSNPAVVRDGGVALLKRLTEMLWPFQFGTVTDLVARIRALELLALP